MSRYKSGQKIPISLLKMKTTKRFPTAFEFRRKIYFWFDLFLYLSFHSHVQKPNYICSNNVFVLVSWNRIPQSNKVSDRQRHSAAPAKCRKGENFRQPALVCNNTFEMTSCDSESPAVTCFLVSRWKIHEAVMLSLGSIKKLIVEDQAKGTCPFDLHLFLQNVVLNHLNENGKKQQRLQFS